MIVTKQSLIGDVLDFDVDTARFFFEIGMHCLGCPSASGETLEQACMVHGADVEKLVNDNNDFLAEKESLKQQGEIDKANDMEDIIDIARKNAKRLANKAGKDAMISEFQSIKDVAVISEEFDKYDRVELEQKYGKNLNDLFKDNNSIRNFLNI